MERFNLKQTVLNSALFSFKVVFAMMSIIITIWFFFL